MSLNGLDSPEVQEAYQVAIAEAGGWFLLKYSSRDSVELLGSGKGGVHEARYAIAKYEEASPLYGLIIYRRRKVVIKYVPDGTSRVLLARTAVHFQDVAEKYSPYETLLEIKTAEGLNDTSLAASFKLHTATPSASSSRLNEISEDGEEGDDAQAAPRTHTPTGSYFGSQRSRMDRRAEHRLRSDRSPAKSVDDSSRPTSPLSSTLASPGKTSISQFLVRSDSGQPSITSLGTSMGSIADYSTSEVSEDDMGFVVDAEGETPKTSPALKPTNVEPLGEVLQSDMSQESPHKVSSSTVAETRKPTGLPELSQDRPITAGRTSTSERPKYDDDPYDFSQFEPKPKVKLGPRAVAAEKAKRPSISSVPATYRPTSKKQDQPRPKSQGPATTVAPASREPVPLPPPIPDTPEYNPRPLSRGSIKSVPSHKSTAMTPDKVRLMKAVELRKKQLRKSNPTPTGFVPPADSEVPDVPKIPNESKQPETRELPKQESKPAASPQIANVLNDEQILPAKKADSGIAMEYDKVDKQEDKKSYEESQSELAQEPHTTSSEAKEVEQQLEHSNTLPTNGSVPSPDSDSTRPIAASIPPQQLTSETESEAQEAATKHEEKEIGPVSPPSRSPVLGPTVNEPVSPPDLPKDATAVPTIVMADGSRPLSSDTERPKSGDSSPNESFVDAPSGEVSVRSSAELEIPEKNPRRQNSDLARRRRGLVEPLHLDDNESVSDEDFMDELQSATVHSATPITVARSPMAAYFQRQPSTNSAISDVSAKEVNIVNRTSTMPSDSFKDADDQPSPYLEHDVSPIATPPEDRLAGMKRTVSTGISRRIQALAEHSSRESSPNSYASARPGSPEMLNGVVSSEQKAATRSPPRSRQSSFRTMTRHTARMSSFSGHSAVHSPRPSESTPVWNVHHDPATNRDSVSVTARIVRPDVAEQTESATDTEGELQQSQIAVHHQRGTPSESTLPQLPRIDTNAHTPAHKPESVSSRGASPIATRASKDVHQSLPSVSQNNANKPTSPTVDDFPVPPTPQRTGTLNSVIVNDENAAPKETSRTSRFFKRMSNLGSKRKSVAQHSFSTASPVSEQGSQHAFNQSPPHKEKAEMPPAIVVGDLNIQFPDSLLWKRRIVEIDDTGCIAFCMQQATEQQRILSKKFQLQEFKMPYVPDLDRQELPNSIMLDFNDGTTLQVACEDTMTHRQVVHVLKTYWKAWAGA